MADVELIGVPFDGYGRAGNQALAADRLREAGLAGAFRDHRIRESRLELPAPDPRRGAARNSATRLLSLSSVCSPT